MAPESEPCRRGIEQWVSQRAEQWGFRGRWHMTGAQSASVHGVHADHLHTRVQNWTEMTGFYKANVVKICLKRKRWGTCSRLKRG